MTTIRRFVLRLLSFFRPGAAEAELSREIHSHLQLLEDEFVSKGMPRDEARLAARRAFGGVEQAKEHQRDARGFRWLDNSRMDFKLGARMLAKYPALSLIGGAGLAVGVAIGAGFFAFLYSFLYATLPVEGGERIVALENWDIDANNEMRRSMHDLVMWQREMKTVGEIGAFRTIARNVTFAGGSAEAVQVAQITAVGFNITRVTPVIGRAIVAADESAGASPIVVIGYDVWHSRFGGDASVLGRELRLGNVVHTIVGVMPEGYGFPVNHSYWIPLSTDAATFGPREGPDIFIFGRLRDGAAMEQAQAELSALGAQAASAFPLTHARLQPRVMPYAHPILDIQGITTRDFTAMQSMISMLALIVAVNVGVLVYARTATRQREIAVRTALGASRRRIVGQLFIEALVLSAAASAAGIGLARFGLAQGFAIYAAEGNDARALLPQLRYAIGGLRVRRHADRVHGRGRRRASRAARDRTTSARHLEAGERHRRAAPGTRLDGHDHCAGGDRGDGTPGNHDDQLVRNATRPDQGQLQRGVLPRGHGHRRPRSPGRHASVRL